MKHLRLTLILCGLILFGGSFADAEDLGKVTGGATLSLVNNTLRMNNIELDAEFTGDGPYLKTTDSENPLRIHGESHLVSGDQYASNWNISENNADKRFSGKITVIWDSIDLSIPLFESYRITGKISFTTENDNSDNLKEFTMPLKDVYVQCNGNCLFNPGSFNFSSTLTCPDSIPPTIILNGPDTLTIEQGQTYVELGAVATDRVGNEVEVTISPDDFTTNKPPGQYEINYVATDVANQINRKIRTVTILSNDHIPPIIQLTEPLDGDTNIPASTTIYVLFSEAMDASSITNTENTFYIANSQGERIAGERNYSDFETLNDGTFEFKPNASFTPNADFAYQETYTVHLTTGVKDIAGNQLAKDKEGNPLETEYTWSFSTESRPQDDQGQGDDSSGSGSGCFISTVRIFPEH